MKTFSPGNVIFNKRLVLVYRHDPITLKHLHMCQLIVQSNIIDNKNSIFALRDFHSIGSDLTTHLLRSPTYTPLLKSQTQIILVP